MEAVDTHQLLLSKENIQPLRQGRDTSKLCAALQAETDSDLQQALERQRNEFEIRLRSSSSDDPLSDWCDYIHWIEQCFVKQPSEGKLNIILRKCLVKFKDTEKYKNDKRFVKICIKYAELEESTLELLSQIHRHGIGVKCAELYVAWAEKYALINCFKKANIIYEKGIENNAEPIELLKEAHQNFHAYLGRKILNNKVEFKPTYLEPLGPPESRQPYNVLRPVSTGQTEMVSNVRIGQNVKGSPGKLKMGAIQEKGPKSNAQIKIFRDSENEPVLMEPSAELKKIPNRKKASKENIVKPGPWTDMQNKKVPFNIGSASAPFQVHRDEEESEQCFRSGLVPNSVLKSLKKDGDYALGSIPLFNADPENRSEIVMYCKDQVYAGGLEFQFEELRAIDYNKRRLEEKEISESFVVPTESNSPPNIADMYDTNDSENHPQSESEDNILPDRENVPSEKIENNKPQPRKTLFCLLKSSDQEVQNKFSTHVALPTTDYSMDQTINTKEALSEMQQLWFSKPASPILHDNTITKQAGKSILKPSRPCFNLYIDESCLDNFKKPEEPAAPLDLTITRSNSNSELQNIENKSMKGMNFEIFKETDQKENDKCDDDMDDNKENDVPFDYCGPLGKSTRKVTGILTPSEDIPVAPLSEEEAEDDEEEDDLEYCAVMPCNTTGITENLTKAFQFPKNESTPNLRKSCHTKLDFNRSVFECETTEDKKHVIDDKEFNRPQEQCKAAVVTALQTKRSSPGKEAKNLSVIVESSREYKSSSSGSSGISTFQGRSFKNYPYTLDVKGATMSSTLHNTYKAKKLSLTGYEASSDSTYGTKSRISVTEKFSSIKEASVPSDHYMDKLKDEGADASSSEKGKVEFDPLEDIDPFCDSTIERFLKAAKYPSVKYAHDMVDEDSELKVLKVGSSVALGNDNYDVKRVLGEGSYARVYDLTNKSTGNRIIAKVQKPPCHWEFYIVKELHLRIKDKIKAESFIRIETAYFFKNASVLLSRPVEFGTLLDTINILQTTDQCIRHVLAVYFTVQMLKVLDMLHLCKIIHADIKPDNFLVTSRCEKPELQLIDFGRSIDMSLLPENTTFTRIITTEGFTTPEMRMGKPWTYQVDLYGVANCSHCLLFGDYMKTAEKGGVWDIAKKIPRYWAREEWKTYFSTLLNIDSCWTIPKPSEIMQPFENILAGDKGLDSALNKMLDLLRSS